MSLSWRKRQAQASDQKSWRALGTDSALWKGIEKNSGNVKVALGGTQSASTEGIVTGLKFKHLSLYTYSGDISKNTIYVSDASNALISATDATAKKSGDIKYDSSMNCTGSGLVFHIANFNDQVNSSVGMDISGIRYAIINGGSGYTVGNTFGIGNINLFDSGNKNGTVVGRITSVTSTKIEPGRN